MMGEVLLYGRISERLYTVLSHWLAPIRGGLLHSNIAFSAVFGAISGSSAASAATVGAVSLPSFWPEATASAGWSDHWRPVATWISSFRRAFPWSFMGCSPRVHRQAVPGRLYPGFLLSGVFMSSFTWRQDMAGIAPPEAAPSWGVRLIGLLSLFPVFILMFLVLGTIYLGVATPTEAAAFGVVGAFNWRP